MSKGNIVARFCLVVGMAFMLGFIGLFGYGAWKIHSTFTLLEVDEEALEAEYAKWLKMLEPWDKAPMDSYHALTKLEETIDIPPDGTLVPLTDNPCEKDAEQLFEPYSLDPRQYEENFTRLENILEDNFRLPLEDLNSIEPELISFTKPRLLFHGLLGAATYHLHKGDSQAASRDFNLALDFVIKVGACPDLIYAAEIDEMLHTWQQMFIFNLPKLDSAAMKMQLETLRNLPTSVDRLIRSYKGDVIMQYHLGDQVSEKIVASQHHDIKEWLAFKILGPPVLGRLDRECKDYLYRSMAIIGEYQEWAKSPGDGLPPPNFKYVDDGPLYVLCAAMHPGLDTTFLRARSLDRVTQTLQHAIKAELKRREAGGVYPLEIPLSEERKIVIDEKRGCIVKTE